MNPNIYIRFKKLEHQQNISQSKQKQNEIYLKHLTHQVSKSHQHLKVKEGILDFEFINYLEMMINYNVGFFETSMEPDPQLFGNCTF